MAEEVLCSEPLGPDATLTQTKPNSMVGVPHLEYSQTKELTPEVTERTAHGTLAALSMVGGPSGLKGRRRSRRRTDWLA